MRRRCHRPARDSGAGDPTNELAVELGQLARPKRKQREHLGSSRVRAGHGTTRGSRRTAERGPPGTGLRAVPSSRQGAPLWNGPSHCVTIRPMKALRIALVPAAIVLGVVSYREQLHGIQGNTSVRSLGTLCTRGRSSRPASSPWSRRRGHRLGPMLVVVGFAMLLRQLRCGLRSARLHRLLRPRRPRVRALHARGTAVPHRTRHRPARAGLPQDRLPRRRPLSALDPVRLRAARSVRTAPTVQPQAAREPAVSHLDPTSSRSSSRPTRSSPTASSPRPSSPCSSGGWSSPPSGRDGSCCRCCSRRWLRLSALASTVS